MAKIIYDHKIDVLIDLNGYTQNNRCATLTYLSSPIQINYLGFSGTLGTYFHDYIIVDKILVLPENVRYFYEEVLYMPHCYQVNDNDKVISSKLYRKEEFGINEDQVFFCCFNHPYKIDRELFDLWVIILPKCENSVLLLWDHNGIQKKNIIAYCENVVLDSNRAKFSPCLPISEHLARLQQVAKIALDPLVCTGCTTTSDALYAGVPVITYRGKHLASRASEPLLKALGLDELVCENLDEYIELAVSIANDKERLEKLKEKIRINIKTKSLFDTKKFAEDFEKLLLKTVSKKRVSQLKSPSLRKKKM